DKNPMVHEKVSSDATKTPRERQLESYAENKVGDTSTLVNKDTNKVSSVWKDKDNQEKSGSRNSPVTVEHEPANNDNNKKKGFWNSIFGGNTSSKKDFQKGSSADGNPMVNEKRSRDRTKSNQEYHMEAYANDHVHDTSTLVGKDTEKVKGTWEDKASRDQGSQEPSTSRSSLTSSSWSNLVNQASEKLHEVEEKVENYIEDDGKKVASMWEGANDTLKDVSNKASHESGRLEEGWENVKSQAKEEADSIYRTASDVVSSTSSKFKEGADQTRRDSSKLMQDQMDRASGVLNETEREANKLKSDTEKTAKSWYAKGTEQAKDSYDSIKDTVDKDIQWTRQKVQEGLNNTKEEVSHLLSTQPKESDLAGHIKRGEKFAEEEEGQLRSTRNNVDKKPAKVVVEHADGKDIIAMLANRATCLRPPFQSSSKAAITCQLRKINSTSIMREQYLHGYKDNERYHGEYPGRTHYCGELRASHEGEKVVLCGWAQSSRDLAQDLIFLPLRDHSGITQLVYRNSKDEKLRKQIQLLSPESIVCVEGIVRKRPEGMSNQKQATGDIEVEITKLYCLNPASPSLPFWPNQAQLPNEEVRLRYRYLDLRRNVLQHNLRLRSLTANTVRDYLIKNGFTEIETPTLFKSTPEGAREYIVPTRKKGAFYALSQSPQQHKQMLMAAGFDRYFQIARCFRDEDLRADRQPEFTQIDLEMSFIKIKDIQEIIEGMVTAVWDKALNVKLTKEDFPHITYKQAMSQYGSDKPDLRFDMKINDIGAYFKDVVGDNSIDCMVVKKGSSITGGELKTMQKTLELANDFAFVKINENNRLSWSSKCLTLRHSQSVGHIEEQLNKSLHIEQDDLVLVHKRPKYIYGGNTTMGRIRVHVSNLMQEKGLLRLDDKEKYKFLWVESFPLFTPDEQGIRKWQSTHHPFTAPYDEDIPLLATAPEKVRGQHYDLVLNGMEIGGGSIRIHSPVMQTFILEKVLQLEKYEYERFDHLIDALGGGCPPHGGIALGFDRMMAILCDSTSIRDVIAFPKAAGGKDFVVNSPSGITAAQLNEYGLQLAN
ncbi:tRNA synthetases class II-domain-containing protein, partial [Cokeromyces recurvatus]|uniref:tRNA synthetases class II-domain-containing protein n=1 Tax=Cokeromyces recurvatus TaxID=90255 RepID=UPI002220CD58